MRAKKGNFYAPGNSHRWTHRTIQANPEIDDETQCVKLFDFETRPTYTCLPFGENRIFLVNYIF